MGKLSRLNACLFECSLIEQEKTHQNICFLLFVIFIIMMVNWARFGLLSIRDDSPLKIEIRLNSMVRFFLSSRLHE